MERWEAREVVEYRGAPKLTHVLTTFPRSDVPLNLS
jgi:hypothetical protein